MYNLELKFPQDFKEKYLSYRDKLLGTKESDIKPQDKNTNNKPTCISKGAKGYLKFPSGEEKEISKTTSQQFKLLVSLLEPQFGNPKTVDIIFESIRENVRPNKKQGVFSGQLDKRAKVNIIQNVIKLCQKNNKLKSKAGEIVFKWDDMQTKIWLEFLPQE